jgi:hypothetical protein
MSPFTPLWRAALGRNMSRAIAATLVAGSATMMTATGAHAAGIKTITVTSLTRAALADALTDANSTLAADFASVQITFDPSLSGDIQLPLADNGQEMFDYSAGDPSPDDTVGAGAWFLIDSQVPVAIDFDNRVGVISGDANADMAGAGFDLSYSGFLVRSQAMLANATNIRVGESGVVVDTDQGTALDNLTFDDHLTDAQEIATYFVDGAANVSIDGMKTRGSWWSDLHMDQAGASLSNVEIKNSTFDASVHPGDIGDDPEAVADFRADNINLTNINIHDNVLIGSDLIHHALNFGFGVKATNLTFAANKVSGFEYGWDDHTGSYDNTIITGNAFSGVVESLNFDQGVYTGTRVTGNVFKDPLGNVRADIRAVANADGSDNVIDGNTFDQTNASYRDRWAIWLNSGNVASGADTGYTITNNHIDGIQGATEAPITVGPTLARTKVFGNTLGQGTSGTTNAAESEAGTKWFFWNYGDSNANIQTWRPANAAFADGKVSFDVAPVVPGEGGNLQPTPPLNLHVYWTADDNAEEYLGVIPAVSAAGRVSIPTTHTGGFIRIQTEGGQSGFVSQYSGRAAVRNDSDTDHDGLTDLQEAAGPGLCATGSNPNNPDTDGDGLKDGLEVNGINLGQRVITGAGNIPTANGAAIGLVSTNPCSADTDGDGLGDAAEVHGVTLNQWVKRSKRNGGRYLITTRVTNPALADTDGDGLTDRQEVTGSANTKWKKRKSDPTRADTDFGGVKDGFEVFKSRTDPTRIQRRKG